jgi:hypothetical protein
MTYDVLILENGEYREYSKNNQAPTPAMSRSYFIIKRIANGKNTPTESEREEYVVVNVWTEHVTTVNKKLGESSSKIKDIVIIQRKSHPSSRSGLESKTE